MKAMRDAPIHDVFTADGTIRDYGRVMYDRYLMRVKTPAESKYPWDYLKVVAKIRPTTLSGRLAQAAANWRRLELNALPSGGIVICRTASWQETLTGSSVPVQLRGFFQSLRLRFVDRWP